MKDEWYRNKDKKKLKKQKRYQIGGILVDKGEMIIVVDTERRGQIQDWGRNFRVC